MQTNNVLNPLQRISKSVDTLIKKHGSEKTADYLETITISQSLRFNEVNVNLQKFIFSETVKRFGITPSIFEKGKSEACKKARATCFYFYKHYCRLSAQSILNMHKKMGPTRRKIEFAIEKAQALVETPAVDKQHHGLHQSIRATIEKFIATEKK